MRRTGWLAALALAVTALVPGVVAQSELTVESRDMDVLIDLPQCALQCFLEMRQNDSSCDSDDFQCICARLASGQSSAEKCVIENCNTKDSLIARNVTSTACHFPIRDNSQTYFILGVTFSIISALAVIQRFVSKLFAADALPCGMDDYMILAAAVVQAPMAAIGINGGIKNGLGRDIWTLEFHQITSFSYYLYVFTNLYFINITCIKLAFLFFYLRVFPRPKIRRILWGTVIFTIVFGSAFLFVGIFQCKPISHYWERWTGEKAGSCVNVSAVAWSHGATSIALDFWMIAIPLSQVRRLNLDWKKKAEVAFMFCVGLFVTIVSILRLASLIKNDVHSPNATWYKQELAIWSTVEVNVGIICACLPCLRTLMMFVWRRLTGQVNRGSRLSRQAAEKDFYRNNRQFGTISRSMAEPHDEEGMPVRPPNAGIRMDRTCVVEFEEISDTASDEARLVRSGLSDLGMLKSSSSGSSGSMDKEMEKVRVSKERSSRERGHSPVDHRW